MILRKTNHDIHNQILYSIAGDLYSCRDHKNRTIILSTYTARKENEHTQKPVGEVINIEYNGVNYSESNIARYKATLAAAPEIN